MRKTAVTKKFGIGTKRESQQSSNGEKADFVGKVHIRAHKKCAVNKNSAEGD